MQPLLDKKVAGKLDKPVQIRYKNTMTFCMCTPVCPHRKSGAARQKYDIDTGKE